MSMAIEIIDDVKPLGGCKVVTDTREITQDEWRNLRKNYIGGSDASAITGHNKYKTPLTLYVDKLDMVEESEEWNDFIFWGNALEDTIRNKLPEVIKHQEESEVEIFSDPFMYQHPKYDFMSANIDGLIIHGDRFGENIGGLEIKTGTIMAMSDWSNDQVPDPYYVQVQHYMSVLNLDWFLVAGLIGKKMMLRYVERNEPFIRDMIQSEKSFWSMVQSKTMPAPSGNEAESEIVRKLLGETEESSEIVDLSKFQSELKEYKACIESAKVLDKRKRQIMDEVKLAMNGSKKGIANGFKVSYSRYETKRFDSSAFKKSEPELYEQYKRSYPMDRLTVTEVK